MGLLPPSIHTPAHRLQLQPRQQQHLLWLQAFAIQIYRLQVRGPTKTTTMKLSVGSIYPARAKFEGQKGCRDSHNCLSALLALCWSRVIYIQSTLIASSSMALLHGTRNGWHVTSCAPHHCRSSFRTRCRVAKPQVSSAVPADKGSVTTLPSNNGPSPIVKSNEYIAGPYGSGRLSQDGG